MAPIDILLIILFILFIAIIIVMLHYQVKNWGSRVGASEVRSKLEARVVKVLEDIMHKPFNQAHPAWLREPGQPILELDGYNKELKIALEVQGPGHIKPIPGETYEKYQKRVARDRLKRALCQQHGVHLITIDYRISPANVSSYLRSRLFDIGAISDKPANYIRELTMIPWQRGHEPRA